MTGFVVSWKADCLEADVILISVEHAEQPSDLRRDRGPICRFSPSAPPKQEGASELNETHLRLTFSPDQRKSWKLFNSSRYEPACQNDQNLQPQQISTVMKWVWKVNW